MALPQFVQKYLRYNRRVDLPSKPGGRRVCMWKAIDEWMDLKAPKSRPKYQGTFDELVKFLEIPRTEQGAAMLLAIDQTDITRYVNWCKMRPARRGRSELVCERVSDATVGYKVKILASLFQYLVECGRVDRNPFRLMQREYRGANGGDRSPTQMVEPKTVQAIFDLPYGPSLASLQDKAILAAGFGGGLRAAEIIGLRLFDVKRFTIEIEDENTTRIVELVRLHLRHTKKGTADNQALPEWASAIVLEHLARRRADGAKDTSPLFTPYQHGYASERILTHRTLHDRFTRVVSQVGLGVEYTPHCMRATPITYLLDKKVPHRDVQKFSRHSSVKMVEHYDKRRDQGAEKIAALNDIVKMSLGSQKRSDVA